MASRTRENRTLLGVSIAGAAMLAFGLIGTGSATRVVLSDMDCTVEPSLMLELGAAVPGRLQSTHYDRADFVAQGALLARLDSAIEEVTLELAQANAADGTAVSLSALTAEFGTRTETRNRRLRDVEGASIAEQSMDQIGTEAAIARLHLKREQQVQARAQLEVERARAQLAQREIRSPIDGSVVERLADEGEYVDGEPVFRVARLDPLHVEVIVPIDYLDSLRAGSGASVTLDAPGYENRRLKAKVRRIDAVADAASATYGVRLTLPNPDLDIPSGVRCRVDFYAS